MFRKILVANRGEIALRVVRACRDLGVPSVAVYSDVDKVAQHVRYADEAYYLGPAESRESYLNVERILAVARRSGADAIHPGYGFLAENADFAEACYRAGITFIGPSPESIRQLGDKVAARRMVAAAGVQVVPGTEEVDTPEDAARQARELGYPLMVKAAAGGGGRGIRLVEDESRLADAVQQAMHEAGTWFGSARVYLEKQLAPVRHIEVQIIADRFGNVVPIGERECSIQRRHQKIIEESPSVAVSPELRRSLCRAAERTARCADYHNVGTVEFLLTAEGEAYFLEMNTRLQVEHPVTEMTSGVDLVKDQILVGAGEELAYGESDLLSRGWAIECRIVAEDPFNNFLPSVGHVALAREPAGPGIRCESALFDGMEVTPYYDSLLAKVTAWGRNREESRARMKRALAEFRVVGVATNIPYLQRVLDLPDFIEGRIDTGFLDRHVVFAEEPLAEQQDAAELAALLLVASGEAPEPATPRGPNGNVVAGRPSRWPARTGGREARAMGRWPRSI